MAMMPVDDLSKRKRAKQEGDQKGSENFLHECH
jgi:hypothetical protein